MSPRGRGRRPPGPDPEVFLELIQELAADLGLSEEEIWDEVGLVPHDRAYGGLPVALPPDLGGASTAKSGPARTAASRERKGKVASFSTIPSPFMADRDKVAKELGRHLNALKVSELRAIAAEMGWPLRGQRREDLVAQMVAHYQDPAAWPPALERLEGADRRLLALLAWTGPIMYGPTEALVASLSQADPSGGLDAKVVRERLRDLYARGWLLSLPVQHRPSLGLVRELSMALPPLPELTPPAEPPPPAAVRRMDDPMGLLANLLLIHWATGDAPLDLQSQSPLTVESQDRTGWVHYASDRTVPGDGSWVRIPPIRLRLPKRFKRYLSGHLTEVAAEFALTCALGLDLLRVEKTDDGPLMRPDPESVAAWLALPPAEQLSHLIHTWLSSEYQAWSELGCLQLAGGRFQVLRREVGWSYRPENFNEELYDLRWQVLQWLQRWPRPAGRDQQGWVAAGPALKYLSTVLGPALLPVEGARRVFVDRRGQPLAADNPAAWEEVGRPLLEYIVEGPLTWLGLLETARVRRNALVMRLTPMALALMDGGDLPGPGGMHHDWTREGQLMVRPSAAAGPLLALAARYGRVLDYRQGLAVFDWSAEGMARALAGGQTAADIAAAFQAQGAPLPPPSLAALARYTERWGNVNLYRDLALITFADALTAREMALRLELDRRGVCQLDETRWLVSTADLPEMVDALRAAGQTPQVQDLGGASTVTETAHGR